MLTLTAMTFVVSVAFTIGVRRKRPTWKQIARDIDLAIWLPLVWYGYIDVWSLSGAINKKWFS